MGRRTGHVASVGFPALAVLLAALAAVAPPAAAQNHLMISEFAVTPTPGEFFEVFNATNDTLDLSQYYVTDYVRTPIGYWRVVDDSLGAFTSEFMLRFPDGTVLPPGETFVVALHDNEVFNGFWSDAPDPDFEVLVNEDGSPGADNDAIPEMVDPGPELGRAPYTNGGDFDSFLTNGGEAFAIFFWDGQSDLVADVDFVQYGGFGSANLTPNKGGVSVDGPDADNAPSTYLADTAPEAQEFIAPTGHGVGRTMTRVDFSEGTEKRTGGNGITGNDETSENFRDTWITEAEPSLGSLGPFGPPQVVTLSTPSNDRLEIGFSRGLDPVTAEDPGLYRVRQLATAGGEAAAAVLEVFFADLVTPTTVRLTTGPQQPVALYELVVQGVRGDDLLGAALPTPTRFRGFNPGPGVRLEVPKRPFVPSLDRILELTYVAPQGDHVLLRVFDMSGRELFVLAEERVPSGGLVTVRWDGRDHLRQRLPAGVYMLHLELLSTGEEITAPVVVASDRRGVLR